MFVTLPRDAAKVESWRSEERIEMEVTPGEAIVTSPVDGLPRGVFVPWGQLTDDQREKFLAVRLELLAVADKLKALFLGVGDVVDGC